jgi:hypothetical protein
LARFPLHRVALRRLRRAAPPQQEPQAAEEEDELEGFSYTEDDPSEMDMSFGIEEIDEPETPPSV